MNYKKNDYLIMRSGTKLILTLAVSDSYYQTEQQISGKDDGPSKKIDPELIVANLGSKPQIGKAYGIHVEPIRTQVTSKFWGPIQIYRKMDQKEKKSLKKALKESERLIRYSGVESVFPLASLEIRNKAGKWAGMYRYSSKGQDTIKIGPETLVDHKYNTYVLMHETGHGVWFRKVSPMIKTQWINLYTKRMTILHYPEKRLKALARDIVEYENGVRDYMKEIADDDTKIIIKEALSYMKRVYRLMPEDIDLLMESNRKNLYDYWPVVSDISTPLLDVSSYAGVSVREFFAESFAYYTTGKILPKDVTKLMKRTLSTHQEEL